MADNFFGFSPESFEQFARALSLAVFGPAVRAFGNGPDGGREATFRGKVPYPSSPDDCWNGYGVIQAKCKEKCESTKKDQEWALRLLKRELDIFVSSERRHPKPEYYVFITNVELSSAAGGGIDTAGEVVKSYYDKLPLKGHAVWDANQLTPLLAVHESVRKHFREFLTTGDILSAMLTMIERSAPNATRILSAFLERELRADEASRLDQAGNRTDDQLRLARLFFDLPASTQPQVVAPKEEIGPTGRLPHGVLREMLRDGARKLDPPTLYGQEESSDNEHEVFPCRYVLLGGPGTGKSTLGQFLAQMHRAALLLRREPHLLEPQTRRTLEETRELCNREGLPWPATPRYPFRIELNRFAKTLASEAHENTSLADYLLVVLKGQHALTHEIFLEWLATYPSLLILDGLDEVPATSNRGDVVRTINDFLAEARQMGADIFVVATSRHQGYTGEFSGGAFALRHILPLSAPRALRYVEAYASARFGNSDPQKAVEVVAKLRESTGRQLTAQLMGTPLQVTFMATVVAARGDPGEDRWQLFESYYRTIYDRERQKAVPPYDAVLSKQQPTIDRLHHDIGFWLQYRGETAGGASVSLPIEIFEGLVDCYLTEVGREGSDKQHLVRQITEAARHRLVFLTSRIPGELSFDVRSLQEYMAAECITSGSPELVQARLKAVAPAPYWRNVFLFAASKCFADTRSRHLQNAIRILCVDLNAPGERFFSAVKAGSDLALDVLQSGAVAENPNYSRHLVHIGLKTLQQAYLADESEEGPSADQRLAVVYRDFLRSAYCEELQLRVGQSDVIRTLGAWPLILRLCRQGIDWAEGLLERHWPAEFDQLMLLAPVMSDGLHVPAVRRRLEDILQTVSPTKASKFLNLLSFGQQPPDLLGALLALEQPEFHEIRIPLRILGSKHDGCQIQLISLRQSGKGTRNAYAAFSGMTRPHPGWLPFMLAGSLIDTPNHKTLARIIDECVGRGWRPGVEADLWGLPWPLFIALHAADSVDDLCKTSERLKKRAIGPCEDWVEAEDRWATEGISLARIHEISKQPNQLAVLFDSRNPPYTGNWTISVSNGDYSDSIIRAFYNAARRAPRGEVKHALICFLCLAGTYNGRLAECLTPSELQALLEAGGTTGALLWDRNYVKRPEDTQKALEWLEFYDWLGCSDRLGQNYPGGVRGSNDGWCELFQEAFASGEARQNSLSHLTRAQRPVRLGLLRLLGRMASVGKMIEMIPPKMLNQDQLPDARSKLAGLLVRISQHNLSCDEAKTAAADAAALLLPPAEEGADRLLFRTIEAHFVGNGALCELLLHLRKKISTDVPLGTARCERLLRRMVRSQSSSIQSQNELRRLQLPIIKDPL